MRTSDSLPGAKKNPYPPLSPLFSFIFRYFFYLNLYSFMTRRATKVIFNKIIIVQTIINNKKNKKYDKINASSVRHYLNTIYNHYLLNKKSRLISYLSRLYFSNSFEYFCCILFVDFIIS